MSIFDKLFNRSGWNAQRGDLVKKRLYLILNILQIGFYLFLLSMLSNDTGKPAYLIIVLPAAVASIYLLIWYIRFKSGLNKAIRQEITPEEFIEKYGVNEDDTHVKPVNFTIYSEQVVDSWDIKDAKPPWEL